MQLGSKAGFVLTILKRRSIQLFFMVAVFLSLGKATVVYGFGGESDKDHSQNLENGSATRDDIIYFENEKVEAGVPLIVNGAPENSTYEWNITGADGTNTFTTTTNSYTPVDADMEKLITVHVEGLPEAETVIYYSTLPVLYINNISGYYGVGDEYSSATLSMQGNDEYNNEKELYSGDIEIRLRGNSTRWREKKPFNIKLDNKTDLLGMGENKHWALLANDIDHTLMRNKLLYDFSGALGMEPYSKSENVVVIFNHEYYGVYQLCEIVNIGSNRVDIYDWEEAAETAAEAITDTMVKNGSLNEDELKAVNSNLEDAMCEDLSWITSPYSFTYDIDGDGTAENYTITDYVELPKATGGVLLEMDFYAYDGHNPSTMITAYSQPLYFKSPEYAITNTTLYEGIQKYIQAFEYALHSTDFIYHEDSTKYQAFSRFGGSKDLGYKESDFTADEYDGKHYTELFDLDSLIQNFIVCEFSMNWDSMKNSVFLYKDVDGLFHMGPECDFDWAWGNINMYNINTWYPTSWHTTENDFTVEQYYQTVQWNRNLIRDPYFLVQVYEKYKEIRGTLIEDIIKDGGTIDTYADEWKMAADANDAKWSYTYSQYQSVGFEESLDHMTDFIHTRVNWMDQQFSSLSSFIDSLGYYQTSSELQIDEVDTHSLDGYTQVTANVNNNEIIYVTFQVNGTHQYTAEVVDGKAICQIPNSDLVSDKDKLNVIQILAKDAEDNYIVDTTLEGNYENAKSNYIAFYQQEGFQKDSTKEVISQIDNQGDSRHMMLVTLIASGTLLLFLVALFTVYFIRKSRRNRK